MERARIAVDRNRGRGAGQAILARMTGQRTRPRAVVFDLDGTLLDTLADIASALNTVLAERGWPTHDDAAVATFVGDGLPMLMRRALPVDRVDAELDGCVVRLREVYGRGWGERTRPFPGVPALLDALTERALPRAILSNKPHEHTVPIVEALLADWRFDPLWGARPRYPHKPDPASALALAEALGRAPRECVFVGDTAVDMHTARAAGMTAVGVRWGLRSTDELRAAGAAVILESPLDLLRLFG